MIRQSEGMVQVRGNLHVSDAEMLQSGLVEELIAAKVLLLNLSAVDSCGTASYQLLCSLKRSAENAGKEFRISASSSAVRETSAILGLKLEDLATIPNR